MTIISSKNCNYQMIEENRWKKLASIFIDNGFKVEYFNGLLINNCINIKISFLNRTVSIEPKLSCPKDIDFVKIANICNDYFNNKFLVIAPFE